MLAVSAGSLRATAFSSAFRWRGNSCLKIVNNSHNNSRSFSTRASNSCGLKPPAGRFGLFIRSPSFVVLDRVRDPFLRAIYRPERTQFAAFDGANNRPLGGQGLDLSR